MGRGKADQTTDDLFYGSDMASQSEAAPEEAPPVDVKALDDTIKQIGKKLITLKRDPSTLAPTDSGERLLASGRSFLLWSGLDLVPKGSEWIALELMYNPLDHDPQLRVVCCEHVSEPDVRIGPVLYAGPFSEAALEAARRWAKGAGSDKSFPLTDQDFSDIVEKLDTKLT